MKFILMAICERCNYERKSLSMLLNLSDSEMDDIDYGRRELNEREIFVLTEKFYISKSFLVDGEPVSDADRRVKYTLDHITEKQQDLDVLNQTKEFFVKNGYGSQIELIMSLFTNKNEYIGADLVKKVDDFKLFKLVIDNFNMKAHSLYVFYDNGDIVSEIIKDKGFGDTYNGGHRIVTYGEHEEGGRGGVEYRIVEDRGIYYETTIKGLFEKNNRCVEKFRKDWNKERNLNGYANDLLSAALQRGELSREEARELLEMMESNKVRINAEAILPLMIKDYLRRLK